MSWIYWLLNIPEPGTAGSVESLEILARTTLPAAAIVLVAAAGVALAALNFTRHIVLRRGRRVLLFALRLAGLALVLAMLLQLEAKLTLNRNKPAGVAIVVDTSESMALNDCSGRSRLAAAMDLADGTIVPRLHAKARFSWYGADWKATPGRPSAQAEPAGPTDLGAALRQCIEHAGSPQAVILLSDGKTTHPDHVADAARIAHQSGVRVFGVCLGKYGPPRAVSMRVTEADNYVRLGDEFTVSASLRAEGMAGQAVDVQLFEDAVPEPRMQRTVQLADKPAPVTFRYRPTTAGTHRYRLAVPSVKGTVTDLGNIASTSVEVIDEPIRVLFLEGTPRFEAKFLNIWMPRDPVLDVTTVTRMPRGGWFVQGKARYSRIDEGLPMTAAELFDYDAVIFGDVPRAVFRQGGDLAETALRTLADFVVKRGGGLITLGGQAVYGAGLYQGSVLEEILPFGIDGMKDYQLAGAFLIEPEPGALAHPVMALGDDPVASREAWSDMPKLDGCNVVGALKPAATLLASRYHDSRKYPVIATHDVGRGRVLSLACDTTWQWEMQRQTDEVDNYRTFWGRAVRFVAADPRTRPGRTSIITQSSRPVVGTEFPLATTLLDANYGPVRNADLRVEVVQPSGRKLLIFPSDSGAAPGVYRYAVPLPEKGLYKVTAEFQGTTTVREIIAGDAPAEMDDPGADPSSLRLLAQETGGRAGTAEELDGVLNAMTLEPERFREKVTVTLWNLPLVAVLLMAAVCADCYIRKRNGLV